MRTAIETTICPTPAQLVENGKIHTGFFSEPFRRVNLLDARNMGGRMARPLRWLRLKEWVGFGLVHPRLFGGIIIQDAKYASSGTVYLYDRLTNIKYEWLLIDRPSRIELPEQLWQGISRCRQGKNHMQFSHALAERRHDVSIAVAARKGTPALAVNLVLHQDWPRVEPLVVSLPIAADHHTYTHKSPLGISGTITIGAETFTFDPARDFGNQDEQKTFYPYRSKWFWGTFVTTSDEGRQVMLNFVDQMTPAGEPGEDALWVDGKLSLLAQPVITPLGEPGHYRIASDDGRIRVTFTPEGAKAEKRNYGVAAIDYAQFYGAYAGEVVDATGQTHVIRNAFGAFEKMSARF